jgi:hypothetical protein
MTVLRAHLTGEKDQLLRAVPVVVLVQDNLEPDILDVVQSEVGNLHRLSFLFRDGDISFCEEFCNFGL